MYGNLGVNWRGTSGKGERRGGGTSWRTFAKDEESCA